MELIVKYVRSVYEGLGDSQRVMNNHEKAARIKYGVSITSKKFIPCGKTIDEDDIMVKCPGGGLSPVDYWKLMGKKATKDIEANKTLYAGDIE